jgi:hypothetical protein
VAGATVFVIIGLAVLVLGIYVAVDIARYPDWAFQRAGTSKALWLVMAILFLFVCGIAALVVDIIWLSSKRAQIQAAAASGGPAPSGPPPGWTTPPPTAAPPLPPATAAPPPPPPSEPPPPAQ